MAEAVYIMCFLTSAAVAWLLLRGYMRTRTQVLLWSGLGFVGLCLNNVMLIIDLDIGEKCEPLPCRNDTRFLNPESL